MGRRDVTPPGSRPPRSLRLQAKPKQQNQYGGRFIGQLKLSGRTSIESLDELEVLGSKSAKIIKQAIL